MIFLEPKRIYRSLTGEVADGDYRIPFGKANVVVEGTDVSLFAYGAMIPPTVEAAQALLSEGIS
ncbi:pyruvate dehydrogenase E1 component, beta subunit, partial [mine drainage metagenome]